MKYKKEEIQERRKKYIAVFEIVLFIISSISFSFILSGYQVNTDFKSEVFSFFDLIPSVSAQGIGDLGGLGDLGGNSFGQGGSGCCFDTNEGLCTPNSDMNSCENEEDGQWFSSSSCEVNQCELGCCVLGQEAQLTTERRCEKLEELHGIPGKFNSGVKDELACVGLADSQSEGACVIIDNEGGENTCKFGTKTECQSIGGDFYEDYLCSNTELDTNCEKQATTNCADGKDEIYWFDSCGNRENIYDSNKEKSWNNGKVLSKENSCGAGSNNIRSQGCGNCDFGEGSICAGYRSGEDRKKSDGDYVCRDLNCRDGLKIRTNGESWCVYDGKVGGGNDVVGSRHFRQLCVNGEIQTEPCADYRKEICVETSAVSNVVSSVKDIFVGDTNNAPQSFISGIQQQISNLGSGSISNIFGSNGGVSQTPDQSGAFCRPNMWEDCSGRKIGTCSQNPDCKLAIVYISSDFHLEKCVPKYPPGNEFGKGGAVTSAVGSEIGGNLGALGDLGGGLGGDESICSAGTETCTVVYEKKCPGGWECIENCGCEEYQFTLQMNNYCRQLGDCGAYVNIAGKATSGGYSLSKEGGKAEKPPRLMGLENLYAVNAFSSGLSSITGSASTGFYNNVQGLDLLGNFGIEDMFSAGDASANDNQFGNLFSGSNVGGTVGGAALGGAAGYAGASALGSGTTLATGAVLETGASFTAGSTITAGAGGAVVTTSAGTSTALVAGESVTLGAGTTGTLASGTATAGAGGATTAGSSVLGIGAVGWAAIGVAAVLGLYVALGCGKQEETEITFECKAWTQPTAGNCDFCNNDPDKPCSKYRCESLGSNCKIVNEGTGYDECVSIQSQDGPPRLSPDEKVLSEGYKYEDKSNNGFKVRTESGECVNPFSPIEFGIDTNVISSCRYSENSDEIYEEMSGSFIEGDVLSKNHTTLTYFPSVESIIASETSSPEEFSQAINDEASYDSLLDKAGEMNLYVKCKNIDGIENTGVYEVNFCIKPGPDLTPPIVLATSPKSDSYVAKNTTGWIATFFINEPAECKYDTSDLGYFEMSNTLNCENDLLDGTLIGYPCVTGLSLPQDENKFYVKCRDQPWLGNDDTSRNIGLGYEYVLKKTSSDLTITSISPSGTITRGSETAQVDLTAVTSGGVNYGESICQYSINEQPYIKFANTNSDEHMQTFTSLNLGNYSIDVRCIDSAGNLAYKNNSFTLELDSTPPSITRIYYDFGDLIIETDEDSSCVYRNDSVTCNYNFENGTSMDFGNTKIHKTIWNLKSISYIKCRDIWGNEPDECSTIVKPYQVVE
ncbi:hypothetical protein J4477_04315 [Candidatus Pacearchaeota archaeon]|nr:hypothetical protein [Candidatus Pacearchaeota archaeon]